MGNTKNTTKSATQRARIAQAREAVKVAVQTERQAAAAMRDARSAVNRATHAARPVPVSVAAAQSVAPKLSAGKSVAVTVPADAAGSKFVSIRAFAGKRVTVAISEDGKSASVAVPVKGGGTAQALAQATRVHAAAVKRTTTARAAVKRAQQGTARPKVTA